MARYLSTIALVSSSLLFSALGAAQTCVDYGEHLRWAAALAMPGDAIDVTVVGDYAYVAAGRAGLQIVDVSAPTAPRILGSVSTLSVAQDVAVDGNYAYVGVGYSGEWSGLQIVDVRDPTSPRVVGSQATGGAAVLGVAIASGHAYVASHDAGLRVVDVSDPTRPGIVGLLPDPDVARGVAVSGDYAYVVHGSIGGFSGLHVVDIRNVSELRTVGSLNTQSWVEAIALVGDHAVLVGEGGLMMVNVEDPSAPQLIASTAPYSAKDIVVAGELGYVSYAFGLDVVDLTIPSAPRVIGSIRTRESGRGIGLAGNCILVANNRLGLQVFDARNPKSPPIVGAVSAPAPSTGLALAAGRAYLASGTTGLPVVDISDAAEPRITGSLLPPDVERVRCVAAAGDHAYIAEDQVFHVVDGRDPAAPRIVGSAGIPGFGRFVAVEGTLAYLLTNRSLEIIDVANVEAPTIVGSLQDLYLTEGITVAGDLALVAFGQHGFLIIDVHDPTTPRIRDTVSGTAYDLAVQGNLAYLAAGGEFRILDLHAPHAILGSVGVLDGAKYVRVSGSFAYVAGMNNLQVFDIRNSSLPCPIGSVATPYPSALALGDQHVWVASSLLQSMSKQCETTTPVFLRSISWTTSDTSVEFRWNVEGAPPRDSFRLVANLSDRSWDVPVVEVGPGTFAAIDRSPRLATVASVTYTLYHRGGDGASTILAQRTITTQTPSVTRLLDPYPSPFNPTTTIPFVLAKPGRVVLSVHDVAGRELVRLVEESMTPGTHAVIWNGRGRGGREAPSGVYFVHLSALHASESRQVVLAR